MTAKRENIEFSAVDTSDTEAHETSRNNQNKKTTSMPDSSCCVVLVLAILGTGVILTVILVPLSLKTLEYYEYGFRRRQTTGSVDRSHVYDGGRHSIGVDYNFKVFSADAHFLEYNNIAIFAADKLEVLISANCQYFLRKDQLAHLHKQYDVNYEAVLEKNAQDAIKTAATQFTTREFIHNRMDVEQSLFAAVKLRLGGQCCEQGCIEKGDCAPSCIPTGNCTKDDMGLFSEVRYFQLHDLSIPSELSGRYVQSLVLQEAEEREQYIQDAQLVRKETDKLVAIIENIASEINENGTAYSTLIRSEATATARNTVESARSDGLEVLYRDLGITDAGQKATFDYLRTVKNMDNAHLAVNYDSLRISTYGGGDGRRKRSIGET